MLRTLHSSEPELLELCYSSSWESVKTRVQTHPFEARVSDEVRQGHRSTALSRAVRSKQPLHVIRELLKADTSQIAVIHYVRATILHEAFKHRVDDAVLELLVDATINYDILNSRNADARTESIFFW